MHFDSATTKSNVCSVAAKLLLFPGCLVLFSTPNVTIFAPTLHYLLCGICIFSNYKTRNLTNIVLVNFTLSRISNVQCLMLPTLSLVSFTHSTCTDGPIWYGTVRYGTDTIPYGTVPYGSLKRQYRTVPYCNVRKCL